MLNLVAGPNGPQPLLYRKQVFAAFKARQASENCQNISGERNAVWSRLAVLSFHSGRRDSPYSLRQIKLAPCRIRYFVEAKSSQKQQPVERSMRVGHTSGHAP